METVVIDGSNMPDRDAAYAYLAGQLNLPDGRGRNLDALFDVLTGSLEKPTQLVVSHRRELEKALGVYGSALLKTLEDAAADNPVLKVVYEEDSAG